MTKIDENCLNSNGNKSKNINNLTSNDNIQSCSAKACENNKDHILFVIAPLFLSVSNVLEIGSGTGQHALYFAEKMQHITWHTSDCYDYLDGIKTWISDSCLTNVRSPFELDVSKSQWPSIDIDAVITVNTVHTMSQQDVVHLFEGVGRLLKKRGSFIVYDSFIYECLFSIRSDEQTNRYLRDSVPANSIKHFEEIVALANSNDMKLIMDYGVPENKRILHFVKM